MSILEQYKKAIEKEKDYEYPTDSNLTEEDKEAYEEALKSMREGKFSDSEINDAIENSKRNLSELGEEHDGGYVEGGMRQSTAKVVKLTDEELSKHGLLESSEISDIKVIRAYCLRCGKELVSKAPAMYNPFTMEKLCLHECCGTKYNLDKTYPHIAYYDGEGNEINHFAQ